MNTFPKFTQNNIIERNGVLSVAKIVNEMGCIWRETFHNDVGLDGQIEYVDNDGNVTGHLIAVQVKAGQSYLCGNNEEIVYYPNKKHIAYWESFPIPIVIIFYDDKLNIAYWHDIRRNLRSKKSKVVIPKTQIFDPGQKNKIFESCGVFDANALLPCDVLLKMLISKVEKDGFTVSFFELFFGGIIDIGRKIFFSMNLVFEM